MGGRPKFEIFASEIQKHFAMATSRGLSSALSSLSISSCCLRNVPSKPVQSLPFSTSRIALGGPIARYRRERAHQKLKKAKERAIELKIQRSARADPVLGHVTEFTSSLLRPREILSKPGGESHTRSGEDNWPMLTNFGISSEDTLTLSQAAKDAEARRLKAQGVVKRTFSKQDQFLFNAPDMTTMEGRLMELEDKDARKREVMAKLIDLANANSKAVIGANKEKARVQFSRHDGDTGSTEVQGPPNSLCRKLIVAGILTVRILALREHMKRNLQDKQTKRAMAMLLHQRQRLLKYLRRTKPQEYFKCIEQIGLDDSAVVAEVR
jgi:ribosomal protein S15